MRLSPINHFETWLQFLSELMNSSCALLTQIYARPEATKAGQADYAANVTGPILSFFEEYSGINYQQNKLGKTIIRKVLFLVNQLQNSPTLE